MYLTKIVFQLNDQTMQAALADCQKMHRLITGFFGTDRKTSNLLYRVRIERNQEALYLYSNTPIDHTRILPKMKLAGTKDISAWVSDIHVGMIKRFDLLALPTKKTQSDTRKNSQRRLLKTLEERQEWMQKKANQFGFQIVELQELESIQQTGTHSTEAGGRMYLQGYHYQGILRVTDAIKFQNALQNGIGAGKAYGFGMLLLS